MVDVFDAGPVIHARFEDIRTVRDSVRAEVEGFAHAPPPGERQLVGRAGAKSDFRVVVSTVEVTRGGGVLLAAEAGERLGVEVGHHVRFAPLRGAARVEIGP
jgi:arginine/ornithine N-succinyltransferase beta subunit